MMLSSGIAVVGIAGSSLTRVFTGVPAGCCMAAEKSLGKIVNGRLSEVRGMPRGSFRASRGICLTRGFDRLLVISQSCPPFSAFRWKDASPYRLRPDRDQTAARAGRLYPTQFAHSIRPWTLFLL